MKINIDRCRIPPYLNFLYVNLKKNVGWEKKWGKPFPSMLRACFYIISTNAVLIQIFITIIKEKLNIYYLIKQLHVVILIVDSQLGMKNYNCRQ